MERRTQIGLARLAFGFVLNVGLWLVFQKLKMSGGVERVFQLALFGGCLALAAWVFLLPVFWKGTPWQAPIVAALLWLPVLVLVQVCQVLLQYW